MMNGKIAVSDLLGEQKQTLMRPNSLSNLNQSIGQKTHGIYENIPSKKLDSRNFNQEQVNLFEKFYQTVKPTDEKTYQKILNFSKTVKDDTNQIMNK